MREDFFAKVTLDTGRNLKASGSLAMEQSTRRNFEAETTYAKYVSMKEDGISQRKKQTYPQISSVWL